MEEECAINILRDLFEIRKLVLFLTLMLNKKFNAVY